MQRKLLFTNYVINMKSYSLIINLYLLALAPLFFTGCSDAEGTFAFIACIVIFGLVALFFFLQESQKNENVKEAGQKLPKTYLVCEDSLNPESREPKYSGRLLYYDETNKKIAFIKSSMSSSETKIIDDFDYSYSRVCPHQIFAFDDKNRNIEIIDFNKELISYRIKYEDIHSVSLLIDDVTIYSKSSTRTVGGALVGGALFGSAGAVVGGLSGDTKVKGKIKSVKIKILIKDPSNPTRVITLLSGAEFEMSIAKPYIEDGTAVQDTIKIIIDMIDKEEAAKASSSLVSSSSRISITDELLKLAELKEKGILSEDEFQAQKQKFLNL